MNVKIGNDDFKISICEDHEDEASPKKVKSIVQDKATEIEKIKSMAAKYGLVISESHKNAPQKTTARPSGHKNLHPGLKPQKIEGKPEETEPPEVTQADIDIPSSPGTVEGAPDVHLERHDDYHIQSEGEVPAITAKKDQSYKTESGREITIPSVLYDDKGGKTDIRIVNTGGDRALQNRFKGLAEGSKGGGGPDFRNQYGVRDCIACNGTGVSRIDKSKSCPKCGGDGFFKG